jgi:hypothetical protein
MFNLSVPTVKLVIASEPFNVAVEENTNVSVPAWPESISAPLLPVIKAPPSPAVIVSAPAPPLIVM